MYFSYFGFSENPFNLTPDPSYLYLSGYHKEALDHLLYGINERKGFITVTGGIGTGKTTLCRTLLRRLDDRTKTALVLSSFITDVELLQQINQEFGIAAERGAVSRKELIDDLNAFLLENFSRGGNAVVLIDEAQNLPHSVLEQLRMLSNLETEKEKLLQIVLVGQPELAELLAMPSLRQLDERITVRYHLKPLGRRDVDGYVSHRLSVAGGGGRVRFTGGALAAVHRFSGGNPRRINAVCDRALLIAYARETGIVKRWMLRDAVKDLRGGMAAEHFRAGGGNFSKQAFVLAALLLIMALAVWGGRGGITGYLPAGLIGPAVPVPEKESAAAAVDAPARPVNAVPARDEVISTASASGPVVDAAYARASEEPAAPDVYLDGTESVARLFRLYSGAHGLEEEIALRLVHFEVPPEFQLLFRKPFRVKVRPSGLEAAQESYLVILSLGDSGAVVLDAAGQERSVDRNFMLDHWSSEVSWLVSGRRSLPLLSRGAQSPRVAEMQKVLDGLGYGNDMNGHYDGRTVEAVGRFQRDTGLEPDGLAGARTLTLLEMMKPNEDGTPS